MADSTATDLRLKNAARFRDLLPNLPPEVRSALLSAPDPKSFREALPKEYRDASGLYQARNAYILSERTMNVDPKEPERESNKPKDDLGGTLSGLLSDLGTLGVLTTTANVMPDAYSVDDLAREARAYAEGRATDWNKTKDYSTARNYFDAYGRAEQEYYDYFVRTRPVQARNIGTKSTNKILLKSLENYDPLDRPGSNQGQAAPDYKAISEKRLAAIEVAAAARSRRQGTDLQAERLSLLRRFADQDPVALGKYLQSLGTEGIAKDATLQEVMLDKAQESATQQRAIQKSMKKRGLLNDSSTEEIITVSAPLPQPQASQPVPQRQQAQQPSQSISRPPRRPGRFGRRRGIRKPRGRVAQLSKTFMEWLLKTPPGRALLIGGIIGLILFIVLMTVVTMISRASQDPVFAVQLGLDGIFGNTPATTTPPPGGGGGGIIIGGKIPDCGQIDSALLSNFNMKVAGSRGDCNAKKLIYGFYQRPFSSALYAKRLKKGVPFTLLILPQDQPPLCHGQRVGNTILMWGFTECYVASEKGQRIAQFLIHETGHIMMEKNESTFGILSPFAATYVGFLRNDTRCYDRGFLRSYSLRSGVAPLNESFAEASADYVYNGKPVTIGAGTPIRNLKSECPQTYDYFKKFVFGGVTFSSDGAPSGGDLGSSSTPQSGGSGSTVGGPIASFPKNTPASNNSCNGKYTNIMNSIKRDYPGTTNANFGDPRCDYSTKAFSDLIRSKDPKNASFWLDIAECESGSPNGYTKVSRNKGAFGRFQMNQASTPLKPTAQDTPGRGDVPWWQQVFNAIAKNKADGGTFEFWGTARCLCAFSNYKNTSQCSYIVKHNLQRTNCNNACVTRKGAQ